MPPIARLDEPCELLPWDSEHFGLRVARARRPSTGQFDLVAIDRWCQANQVECLYLLADIDDPPFTQSIQADGFQLVDIRITFANKHLNNLHVSTTNSAEVNYRQATKEDLGWLASLSRASFVDSRFYADGRFPRNKCDELYEIWIRKSVDNSDVMVLVAEVGPSPTGFITCSANSECGNIGLLAIASEFRGMGLARNLIQRTLVCAAQRQQKVVSVVTQLRNTSAIRAYESCGFRLDSSQAWYHKWYTSGKSSQG